MSDAIIEAATTQADLDPAAIQPSRGQVERWLGYRREPPPDYVAGAIEDLLGQFPDHADAARMGWRLFPPGDLAMGEESFTLGPARFDAGRIICRHLARSEAMAVFVATAGEPIDRWIKALFSDGNPLHGYLVDAIGSLAAELAGDRLQERLGDQAGRRDMKLTYRLSPGYSRWDVSEQHRLFALLPEGFCGVRLSDSAMMKPRKSISGVIGMGRDVRKED